MRKRYHLSFLLAVVMIWSSFIGMMGSVSAGGVEAAQLAEFAQPVDLGSPIQTPQTIDAAYGEENGVNVVYTTVTGSPSPGQGAVFNVIDIDNQRLLRSFPLADTSNSWSHLRTPDGRVFIGASKKMFVYSPVTQTVTDLGIPIAGTESIWSLTSDENGNVYGGIYSSSVGGRIFRIDSVTLEVSDLLGEMVDNGMAPGDDGKPENYVRSMAYYNGFVYAGTGTTNGRVWKINPTTKEKTFLQLPGSPEDPVYGGFYDKMGAVYGMTVVDHYLFAFFNGPFMIFVYDLESGQWRDKTISNVRGLLAVTKAHNGKVYTSKKDKFMWEIDVATLEERPVMDFDGSIRSSEWMNVRNQPDFTGPSMVTISYDGKVVLYDPPNNKKLAMRTLVEGQANSIQALETGPDGKLYMSSYMGTKGAQYDPETEQFTVFSLGQSEGIGYVGDTLYFGVYPKAEIHAWNTKDPLPVTDGPAKVFDIGNEQDRPFVVTEGGGKLLLGTIPGYSQLGGALTIYDPAASLQSGTPVYEVHRNIVENQSITGLLYRDGLIYGGTSIQGGLGGEPTASKAKLFVWDMVGKRKLYEWEPALPGISQTVPMISGLLQGHDGLIWATANGFIFAFDPDTREVVKSKNVYPEVTNYGKWRPVHLHWGANGLLYTDMGGKLTVIDPVTLESLKLVDQQVQLFTLDHSDRVYFADATRIKRFDAEPLAGELTLSGPATVDAGASAPLSLTGSFYGWSTQMAAGASYTVSDPQLARIEKGRIVGLQSGSVTVTASYGGHQSAPITVQIVEPQPVASYLDMRNPDFEEQSVDTTIPGWSVRSALSGVSSFESSVEQANTGSHSLKLIDASTSNSSSLQSDPVEVLPGRVYTANTKIYLGNPPTNPVTGLPFSSSRSSVLIRYYDAAMTELTALTGYGKDISAPARQWTDVDITTTAPANAKYMRVILQCSISWVTTAYYDSVSIKTMVKPSELPEAKLIYPVAEQTMPSGSDAVLTVKASQGSVIQVLEEGTVVAQGTGNGDTPVALNVPAPAGGTHRYTVKAVAPGIGASTPIAVPAITVDTRKLESLRLELPKAVIMTNESIQASVYGLYTVDGIASEEIRLTEGVTLTANPSDKVTISGLSIKGAVDGDTVLTAVYGGKTASGVLSVEAPPEPVVYHLPITNPSFEEVNPDGTIPGWKVRSFKEGVSSLEVSAEQHKAGERSLKLIDASTTNSTSLESEPLAVEPNKEYTAHAAIYLGNPPINPATGTAFSSSRSSVLIRYYDAAMTELAGISAYGRDIQTPPRQWTDVDITTTAPSNAKYMKVILQCSVSWVTTAYYDDISVYTLSPPEPEPAMELTSLRLELSKTAIQVNETVQAAVYGFYSDGAGHSEERHITEGAALTAEPGGIVSIDGYSVTGAALGETVLTAVYGGKQATAALVINGPIPAPTAQAVLAGATLAAAGQTYELTYGLSQVAGSIVGNDLTVAYDPERFEFEAAEAVNSKLQLLSQETRPGSIRVILGSAGTAEALTEASDLLKLRFRVKALTQPVQGTFSVTGNWITNSDGRESEVPTASHTITITLYEPGDLNGDGRFSIGDLGILVGSYGATSADPDWSRKAAADLDGNGEIGIADLTAIARKILGN